MSDAVNLHDLLFEDFGVDLPIRGGAGEKTSPVIVSAPTLQAFVDVQMEVLRCIGLGRRVAWRLLEQEVLHSTERTVRAHIETIQFTELEIVTHRLGYHFVVESLVPGEDVNNLPEPIGFRDSRSKVRLPYQLGWLHFTNITDHESVTPGLGTSAAFAGLDIKATVYVYASADPPPLGVGVESERAIDEFRTAVGDVLRVNEGAEVNGSRFVHGAAGAPLFAVALLKLSDDVKTWVILTVKDGVFVKGRVTYSAEEFRVHQMALESIVALMSEIHADAGITASDVAEAGQDSDSDALALLFDEFRGWYLSMANAGEMPRALTAIKADGRKFVVVLEGLGFDHVQHQQFVAWLCGHESIEAYVHARPVQALDDSDSDKHEVQLRLFLSASSMTDDIALTMTASRSDSGAISYGEPVRHSGWDPFVGLQRNAVELAPDQRAAFEDLWKILRAKAHWPGEH